MSDNPLKPQIIPSPINPTGEPPVNDAEMGRRRVAVAEEIEWLQRLTANEDFRRYVDRMKEDCDVARRKIDAIETLTAEQSGRYAQKFIAQLDMAEWADRQLVHCVKTIRALDEQRKLQS